MIQYRQGFSYAAREHGVCSICHCNQRPLDSCDPNGPREGVVSIGVIIEMEGEFEICEHCAVEIGQVVGLVKEALLDDALAEVAQLQTEVLSLEDRLTAREQAVMILTKELANAVWERQPAAALPWVAEEPAFAS
jgi:hypothetical protein